MSQPLSRRNVLTGGLAAAALAGLSACNSGTPGTGGSQTPGGAIKWWDQFLPLADLEKKMFADFTAAGGPAIEYTTYNPNEQGKALQLAFQSKQLPDVFTLAGVATHPSVLQSSGWFQPLVDPDPIVSALPEGSVIDGLSSFGGEVYSFPTRSFRQYDTLVWANGDMLEQAGIESGTEPLSWDQLRANVRTAQEKTGKPGLLLPLGFAERMATFVNQLAQTAGFPGGDGMEYTTGAYRYDHDAYLQAIEFIRSFQTDKLLFGASSNMDAREGRARWVAGESVYFFDGPYCAGVCKTSFPEFLDKLAVGNIPTPDGAPPKITSGPVGGTFWISATSGQAEQASKLLAKFVSPEYNKGLAAAMDFAPIGLESVADSDAHETYKQVCAWYLEHGFLGPSPVSRKPEVATVIAATKPVQPGLGAIIQGILSGDVPDAAAALKKLSDDSTAAREAAIKAKGGGTVTVDDWVFPDWQQGVDYTGA